MSTRTKLSFDPNILENYRKDRQPAAARPAGDKISRPEPEHDFYFHDGRVIQLFDTERNELYTR